MGRMVDQTGLNERLQQHTQRSGMMIGVSMAVVVVVLVGSFTWIFFRLDPFFSDFIGRTGIARSTVEPARVVASPRGGTPETALNTTPLPVAPTPTALSATSPAGTVTPQFQATHVITDFGQQVNLRAGPSTTTARLALLPPGTRLRYLNEQEQIGDVLWMHFQLERGENGWIRQIDVTPLRQGTPTIAPTTRPTVTPTVRR